MHANGTVKRHCITWSRKSKSKISEEDGSGNGEDFISTLVPGDRIGVWARARYPGWANFVSSARIELAEHLDDLEGAEDQTSKDPSTAISRSSAERNVDTTNRSAELGTEHERKLTTTSNAAENPIVLLPDQPEDNVECNTVHNGVRCDGPGCIEKDEYIKGIRYKCAQCVDVDFCASCLVSPRNAHDRKHTVIRCIKRSKFLDTTGMADEELEKAVHSLEALGKDFDGLFYLMELGSRPALKATTSPIPSIEPAAENETEIQDQQSEISALRRAAGSLSLLSCSAADGSADHCDALKKVLEHLDQRVKPAGQMSTVDDTEDQLIEAFKKIFKSDLALREGRLNSASDVPTAAQFTEHGLRIVGPDPHPNAEDFVAKYDIGPDFKPTVEYRSRGPSSREGRVDLVTHDGEDLGDYLFSGLEEHTYLEDEGDYEDKLQCRLIPVDLDEPPQYEALSYTWKETSFERANYKVWNKETDQAFRSMIDFKHLVYLPRSFININTGLRDALRRLRHKDRPRYIWADQISINKSSLAEREIQVSYMRLVYNRSQRVLVWVGEEDEYTAAAFSLFEMIWEVNRKVPGAKIPTPQELADDPNLDVPPFGSFEWTAVLEFFKRPVFQRGWVIQEITLGQAVDVVCGEHEIPWSKVANVADLLQSPTWTEHIMVGTMNLLRRKLHTGQEMTLHFLLRETRPFSVTDPRDKIFAILGIYGGDCPIKADYTKEKAEVFVEATKWIIGHEKTLDIFGQIGAPEGRDSDLPSWVPDYGSVSDSHDPVIELCIPQAKHRASGGTSPSTWWPLAQHPNTLQTTSYHLDTLVSTVDVPTVHRTEQILWFSRLASSLGPQYVTGETVLDAFWRTCVTDEMALCEQPAPTSYLKALGVHARVAASNIADADGEMFQSLSNQVLDELTSQYFTCANLSDKKKAREVVTEVILHFGSRAHNRKLFVTSAGYLCLVAASAIVGDEVHVIAGAKVPFILRREEKGFVETHCGGLGLYKLIGEAYVHGMMKGEALQRDGFEWQDILLK
ncbi:hypothetical protein SLS56_004482 [Neofusicoccum ribis]|uniref:Heterokaryon incompatibility domain-containing protein n=1 Tax=Neofusicoccum ribis TaxID=45134 RepID=A0ABR3SWD4_9PEZI